MRITILTDIPIWVQPLAVALRALGAEGRVVSEPNAAFTEGLIINRISTKVMRRNPGDARLYVEALEKWAASGRAVVHGADCFRLGCSKMAQAELIEAVGLTSPATAFAIPGSRALAGRPVLLKPPAGGFGKGIRRLEANEPAPEALFEAGDGWVEQAVSESADGRVHRVEILGSEILYEASTPIDPQVYNYCLAKPDSATSLRSAKELPTEVHEAVLRVTDAAGMELGAVEYLPNVSGAPVLIDINPVSSLHPEATALLGQDPLERTATYLIDRYATDGAEVKQP